MSADNGIHVKETEKGFEVRYWMGDSEGSLLGTFPLLDDAIKRGQKEGPTEYGFTFEFFSASVLDAFRDRVERARSEMAEAAWQLKLANDRRSNSYDAILTVSEGQALTFLRAAISDFDQAVVDLAAAEQK